MEVDAALVSILDLDSKESSISGSGGISMSAASTSKITTKLPDGSTLQYFVKTGRGRAAEAMFRGEHASLEAINNVVPTLCPKSFGYGELKDGKNQYFLVTDFLDMSDHSSDRGSSSRPGMSLAQKLAKLHTTPAPVPSGYDKPRFGFPVPTCCGDTEQDNTYSSSWAEFYANRRLRFILAACQNRNGSDPQLETLVEKTCTEVIPRLLGDNHLNNGNPITPVVIHGDLWSGNASHGRLPGMSQSEDVVFDSSACYAHSEFELGIMRMFGGFGSAFEEEYHRLVPITEPVEEYEDRVRLYELYHHLNHVALFGGGYRGGAVTIMEGLIGKYGEDGGKSEL